MKALAALLRSRTRLDLHGEVDPNCFNDLLVSRLAVTARADVYLIITAGDCLNSATGNGPMWLVRFEGEKPVILAAPSGDFYGFLWSVQPTMTKQYRDLVVAVRQGGWNFDLQYFRFDGVRYQSISKAIAVPERAG
jgi:hypothetical protein